MKIRFSKVVLLVEAAILACGSAWAAIDTGSNLTFVYQQDVSSNKDGNQILIDAESGNQLQWFESGEAWVGQSGSTDTCAMVLHFKAPMGFRIQSATVFTRSYIQDDYWQPVALSAYWGVLGRSTLAQYYGNDTRFYHRTNGTGVTTDENTTTINVGGYSDLYLTFTTSQTGYYSMSKVKKWFVTPSGEMYDPGLRVTLTLVADPVPTITIDGNQLLIDGDPLRGVFVVWHAPGITSQYNEAWYRSEFRRMKNLGITGVGLEAGWLESEPTDGNFVFESLGVNLIIEWARKEGLWVTMLLTPHYTPGWVFSKNGDVKMKDSSGNSADGSFLTFSPSSPAVDDQIDFQAHAIEYFEKYPNIIAFYLTNEQGYGQMTWLDYSTWAQSSWNSWLQEISTDSSYWQTRWGITSPVPPTTTAIPASDNGQQYKDWQLFRSQEMNRYFNKLYDGAVAARSRFIPVCHKFVFYNAFDAHARMWGLHLSPLQTKTDIVACDAYGSVMTMLAGQLAFDKPILLAETNFPSTPTGSDGQGAMTDMLLKQYFHGVQVQTIYAWNNYDSTSFPWGMFYSDTSPLTGTLGVKTSGGIVSTFSGNTGPLEVQSGLLIPTERFLYRADWYWMFQHPLNSLLGGFDKYGIFSRVIYSDDVTPSCYLGLSGEGVNLDPLKVISTLAVSNASDSAVLESDEIKNWVNGGGVLFIECWDNGPPSWTGISAASTSRTTYTYASGATHLRCSGQSRSVGISYRLTSSVSGSRYLATWDGLPTTQYAIMAVPYGSGWVVVAGTPLFDVMSTAAVEPLLWDVLDLAGYTSPVSPVGPTYLTMGNALYLKSDGVWSGTAQLPATFTGNIVLTQYDANAVVMTPTVSVNGSILTGTLSAYEFCIVRMDAGPGDANSDGKVDVGDLGILAANYGTTSGATWSRGDFNHDGKVDVGDLGILAANYGAGTSGADYHADYARVFGVDTADEKTAGTDDSASGENEEIAGALCSPLAMVVIVGLLSAFITLSMTRQNDKR